MALTMLYGETEIAISLDISSYLTLLSLDIADRTDLIFMLKSDPTMLDVDAEYAINEGTALTVSGNIIRAKINDYSNILVGVNYWMAFGIKFAGDTLFREMPLISTKREVKFRQDVSRG